MEQLKLNMIPNGVNPVFHASQYDKGRQIRFVLDETLSSAEVTTLYRAKDGTEHGNVQMSVSGNTITDTIPEEVLTDYGIIEGEVNIGGIGSLNFFVEVEKDAYDGGVITTQTATGAIATFETNIETAFVSLKSDINPVQSGTGTPSPQNVRPISGFSALNVTRTGKNLCYQVISGASISGGGQIVSEPSYAMGCALLKKGVTYTVTTQEGQLVGGYFSSSPTIGSTAYDNTRFVLSNKTITPTKDCYIAFRMPSNYTTQPQVNIGSTALPYVAYNGQTLTVNFGQTVYGGVADVTNGKVTLTHGFVNLGDLSWSGSNGEFYSGSLTSTIKKGVSGHYDVCISDTYNAANKATLALLDNGEISVDTAGYIQIKDTSFTSASTFKSTMASTQLVYELATSTEITTTPENLTAIVGENNVYSDTNGDTTVEYYIEV